MHTSSSILTTKRIALLCLMLSGMLFCAPNIISAQPCGGLGQLTDVTSQGTEFLLCFMQNEASTYPNDNTFQDIYIASAGDSTTVTITCRAFPNWSKVIHLEKDSSKSFRLSADSVIRQSDAIMEDEEIIDETVFRVVATTPIACYGMNNKTQTADAFLALPKSVAGIEYRVMSYYNSTPDGLAPMPSEFAVASFDDDNTVTIIPSALTQSGVKAGVPIQFVLNAGQGVQIQTTQSISHIDLTGSTVRSTKKIVVYGGHARADVPNEYFYFDANNNKHTSRDHLCEAIPPLADWGMHFIAKNFGRDSGDVLRVLAKDSNTIVSINGKPWGAPFNKINEYRDYTFEYFSDSALGNIAVVESNHPILVGMIAHTANGSGGTGDPFLAIVPPLDESFNDFTYFISEAPQYFTNQQYLIIATEISGAGTLSIDNKVIDPRVFTTIPQLIGGKKYAATTLPQTRGIHHIVSPHLPADGFTILAYGWGDVISYGYTAGYLLKPITGIMQMSSPLPTIAPTPGGTAPVLPPSISIRDILTERVYFDSARITYSQNKQNITVRLKKDIALETGTIETAEEKTLELTTSKPVEDVILGNVRIWYHSKLWTDMIPVDFAFEILPQSQADVKAELAAATILENYPNPASGKTNVHFRLPSRTYASVKIYDALGRTVRTISQGMVGAGDQNILVNTKGMSPGEYTLELLAPELGINEHKHLIVIE